MKKYAAFPALALLGGAGAFTLRLLQNLTGFEADTGLPIPDNLYARLLPLLLAALAAAFLVLSRTLPSEKDGSAEGSFADFFAARGAALPAVLVAGIFLWFLSGAYGVYAGLFLDFSRVEMLCGFVTVLSAGCLFPAAAVCRRGGALNGNLLLAPVICLVIRLVLAYRADSINPALGAYYVEMLALASLILAFYRTSSFAFGAGRTRRFAVYAALAVVLGCATLGDSHTVPDLLLYGGSVLLVLGLLMLRLSAAARPAGTPPENLNPPDISES